MTTWPITLPDPMIADYSAADAPTLVVTPMETGPQRRTRLTKHWMTSGSLSIIVVDDQADTFRAMLSEANDGADWIDDVPIDTGRGRQLHRVRFGAPRWQLAGLIPNTQWRVTIAYETDERLRRPFPGPSAPVLKPVTDITVAEDALPSQYNMSVYLLDAGTGSNLQYSLTGSVPSGVTINSSTGLMTVAVGTNVNSYSLSLRVTTSDGSDSQPFDLTVSAGALTAPTLSPVSDITVAEDTLPKVYQMSGYLADAGTGAGPIVWSLSGAPAGVTINSSSGAMTVADTTAVNVHSISLVATNGAGSDSEPFKLTVSAGALTAPTLDPVSNITVDQSLLPEIYQMNIYLNDPGTGTGLFWGLSSAPTGVTINSSTGAMTVAANTSINTHGMSLVVTNSAGSDSEPFDLTVQSAAPVFTVQPTNQSETEPDAAVFGPVVATNAVSARWEAETAPGNATWSADLASIFGGRASGATGDTLTITPTDSDDDRGIRVIAIASGGAETSSNEVTLHVAAAGGELPYFHEFNADLGGFVFTRSSSAWGVAEDGIFYESTTDEPVYPGAGNDGAGNWIPDVSFKGLLLEGTGENFIPVPGDLSDPLWVRGANVLIGPPVSSPIDGISGHKITENINGGSTFFHDIIMGRDTPTFEGNPSSITVIGKAAERLLAFRHSLWAGNITYQYDFDLGEIVEVSNGGIPDPVEITALEITELADEWVMFQSSVDTVGVTYPGSFRGILAVSNKVPLDNGYYTGTIGLGVHACFFQYEAHPFPTSLMLNGPRAATSCTQTLASMGMSDFFNDFSIHFKYEQLADSEFYSGLDDDLTLFSVGSGSSNRIRLTYTAANSSIRFRKITGGSLEADISFTYDLARGRIGDIFYTVSSTEGCKLYTDGILRVSEPLATSDFSIPVSLVEIGNSLDASHFIIVRELNVYPTVVEAPPGAIYEHQFNADLGGFTLTRASSAWGVAEDGVYYESTTDEPVYPGAGNDGAGNWTPHAGFKGLLLEGAGENHIADPTTIGTASWTNTATTIISADVASPIDGLMADKLQEDSSASNHTLYQEGSWIDQDNLPVMNTFICKGAGRLFTRMQLQARADQVNRRMTYEFSTGEFTNVNSELTLFYRQVLADGWAAVYQGSETISSGTNTGRTEYALSDGIAINYQGDGASGNHLAAVQTEIHPFPTSLMLNGTRAATSCTQTLADMGFPDGLVNNFTVRLRFEFIMDLAQSDSNQNVLALGVNGASSTNRILWYVTTGGLIRVEKFIDNVREVRIAADISNKERGETVDIVAVMTAAGGTKIYSDGELIDENVAAVGDLGEAVNTLILGYLPASAPPFFIVKELGVYPFELTPLQIWSAAQ